MGQESRHDRPTPESYDTRIGELSFTQKFEDGYPTTDTVEKLYDEIDFQRGCQAYLWSIPLVTFTQYQYAYTEVLGAANGELVYTTSFQDNLGGITQNTTTPYAGTFFDLSAGPFVLEMPEGEVRGMAHDMWQISITEITEPGTYLFVGPGQDVPTVTDEIDVYQSPTTDVSVAIRLIPEDEDEQQAILEDIAIYPFEEQDDPNPRGYLTPDGRPWQATPPRGIEYWERLADIIDREPVFERDRFFMAMLKPLGIEKGKPFDPNERQQELLTDAAFVGEAMAKATCYAKRIEAAQYDDDVQWQYPVITSPDQRADHYDELDERASQFYEAVTNDEAVHGHETGEGQVYLGTYRDANGEWLDGGKTYTLHIPPDVPAETFWSVTAYDVSTRGLIDNDQEIAAVSSRTGLIQNDDGSFDVYFGPDAPDEREQNWIPTVSGKGWFAYFRLYSPTQPFMDHSWALSDIEP